MPIAPAPKMQQEVEDLFFEFKTFPFVLVKEPDTIPITFYQREHDAII
tara:strand:- start:222 stop:365 length:144 start_codon:yes stop_codon:yes gene_type:complete